MFGRHLGALCTKRVGGWQHYCLPPVLTPSHSPHPHAHPGPWSVVSLPVPGVCVGWLGSSSPPCATGKPSKLLAAWVLVVVGATAPHGCAPGEHLAFGPFTGEGHGETRCLVGQCPQYAVPCPSRSQFVSKGVLPRHKSIPDSSFQFGPEETRHAGPMPHHGLRCAKPLGWL